MCGRYSLTSPPELLVALFGLDVSPLDFAPRYNIAPTQPAPIVRTGVGGDRELVDAIWGLVPSWSSDPADGPRPINSRSETASRKRAFREAWQRRRCLVPADGFYEWKSIGGRKQPYYIRRHDGRPFAFAGLWERWTPPVTPQIPELAGRGLETFTILTTEPNDLVRDLHDRMPVILPADAFDAWLDPAGDPAAVADRLRPAPEGELTCHPVSRRVNRPANDDAGCIEPVSESEADEGRWPW